MRNLTYAMFAGILLLTGCNNIQKPNDTNFKNAINRYLRTHGQACTWIGQAFPVDVSESQQKSEFGIAAKMAALEQAGLVQSTEKILTVPEVFGGSIRRQVRRYQPTAAGTRYIKSSRALLNQTAGFCYGTKTVDAIVKWTEPVATGPVTQTEVTYTYKISGLSPWAQRPDIQAQFADIRATISGISKTDELAGLQLTNQGWDVPTP
jgi:hypothetical protein